MSKFVLYHKFEPIFEITIMPLECEITNFLLMLVGLSIGTKNPTQLFGPIPKPANLTLVTVGGKSPPPTTKTDGLVGRSSYENLIPID